MFVVKGVSYFAIFFYLILVVCSFLWGVVLTISSLCHTRSLPLILYYLLKWNMFVFKYTVVIGLQYLWFNLIQISWFFTSFLSQHGINMHLWSNSQYRFFFWSVCWVFNFSCSWKSCNVTCIHVLLLTDVCMQQLNKYGCSSVQHGQSLLCWDKRSI